MHTIARGGVEMKKPLVYVTRNIPTELSKAYEEKFTFFCWEEEETPVPREELRKHLQIADALICMVSDSIDKLLIKDADHLKIIANLAVGYDNIDIEAAKSRGIIVTNTPDVLTETTADLGFALLLATARRLIEANNFIRQGEWKEWSPYLLAGADVHHKTIGIVGMGRIGKAMARRAQGFGMNIVYHNRSRDEAAEKELGVTYVSFHDLLNQADFVVSVVPFTHETKDMFNSHAFQMMKETAVFINISRGGVVNEADLIHALQSGVIQAAGLDVFKEEPIQKNHPLLQLPNVVALPHIGSASVETRTNMWKLCLDNVAAVLNGESPKTPV